MKRFLKGLGVFLLAIMIIAVIPVFIPEDEFTIDAEQWFDGTQDSVVMLDALNRFNAIVGFRVAANKDMILEGASLIAKINHSFALFDYQSVRDAELNKAFTMNVSTLYLEHIEAISEDPVVWLKNNPDIYISILKDNGVLLQRYRQLMRMEGHSYTLSKQENFSYTGIVDIHILNTLSIVDDFINKDSADAIARLNKSIAYSKLALKDSDTLTGKMVAVAILKNDIRTYSTLLDYHGMAGGFNVPITNLSSEERSVEKMLKSEFVYRRYAVFNDDLTIKSSVTVRLTNIAALLFKFYLKPKNIINEDVYLANKSLERSHVPFLDRDNLMYPEASTKRSLWRRYADPLSTLLVNEMAPSYDAWIDRIAHTDGLISLVNLKSEIYLKNITADKVHDYVMTVNINHNTNYNGIKIGWNTQHQELYFDLPPHISDYREYPRIKLDL